MPILGLGTFENIEHCVPACLTAFKSGYRHIDSARYYKNEAQVGEAVRRSEIPRQEVFVTSKIYHPEHGYQSTIDAVEDSLNNFGHDYFDLYMIHSALSGKEKRLETWKALIDARDAGKIKTIGVSNYRQKHIEEIRDAGLEIPAVNQIELHPFCQQREIVEYCNKEGIIVQAYSPLVMGRLDHPVLQRLAKKWNKDAAQIAIRWSLQHGFVPLPKSARSQRVLSNSRVFDFELSAEDMSDINAMDMGREGAVTWNPVDAP
ncbi:Aldo/keto reductase [Fomes fomentarius]|nr:Aldo/keto reductase [Fomes fomentarius]